MVEQQKTGHIIFGDPIDLLGGNFHWLSFCDPNLPEGQQFLGVAIVQAPFFLQAVTNANWLGINPGGEVQGIEFPDGCPPPPERFINRLLTKEECAEFDKEMGALHG